MVFNSLTDQFTIAENLKANRRRMKIILELLNAEFKTWRRYTVDPFSLLVGTVLSQNTNDRNSFPAYRKLISKFRTPEQMAKANVREIRTLIRTAGLSKIKSKRLKEISREILKRYDGNVSLVLKKPLEEAREELLSLPGVGFKTADVVLAFGAMRDVFPVDTHVFRISKRLGFADKKDDHENVRKKLEMVTSAGKRIRGHTLMIQLGRRYCRARNPVHLQCPINCLCPIGIRHARHAQP